MADTYSFIVIRYPERETADQALKFVRGLAKEKVIRLKDAVAITKTDKGRIKLHQTKDDPAGRGFLKGGVIGTIFAVLFGAPGWIAAGALLGTGFSMFDRGIKNELLKELGENMAPHESAMAVLVEAADWATIEERTGALDSWGEVVISELTDEHLQEILTVTQERDGIGAVPEEVELRDDAEVLASPLEPEMGPAGTSE